MDLGIDGKAAAVAGASAGLGLAVARALAAEGVRVAICGRDRHRIDDAAESIIGGVVPIVADVSTAEGATAFVEEADSALGAIDILIANAGGPPPGTFASTDVDAYFGAIELNLVSVIAMCKRVVPTMQAARWGRVVAITSVAVRQPIPELILSNTARAGLTGFLKTLALEVAADGVTVNSLQPGLHDTDRLRRLHDGDPSQLAASVPVQRIGRPEDFGAFAAFVCSDQARFITGSAIAVDGGAHRALL